ncbi:hypothetical protein V6N13_043262 [Hibiscus sabdariffa]
MWRIANKFLQTFDNLQRRCLMVNNVCPLCNSPSETVEHLMRECVFVCQLLSAFNFSSSHTLRKEPWLVWLASFFLNLSEKDRILLLVIFWSIWFSRNKLVHEGYRNSVYEVVSFANAFIHEQDSISVLNGTTGPLVLSRWEAPPHPAIKVNFDSAFNQQNSSVISGAIRRSSEGLVMAACVIPHSNVPDAFVAEAVVCQQAVQFVKDMGLLNVIIEGDSLTVIKKLNYDSHDRSIIAPIIADIMELAIGT